MKARSRSSSIPAKRSRQRGGQMTALQWTKTAVLRELKGLADPKVRAKMEYFGRNTSGRIIGLPNNYGRPVFMKRGSSRR